MASFGNGNGLFVPPPLDVFIPKTPIYDLTGIKKIDLLEYENFSQTYASNKPKILFIVDYIVNQKKIGNLIVFQKYKISSHYEIFKRNIFSEQNSFQRILFLGEADLQQETNRYTTYLKSFLGLESLVNGSYYAVMDPLIKEDRIYEYKLLAARLPPTAREVDYDYILQSKKMLYNINVSTVGNITLDQFATMTMGSKQLGWLVSLVNRNIEYFGSDSILLKLSDLMQPASDKIFYPSDLSSIKKIFDDSVSLFGLDETVKQLYFLLGGLSSDFIDSFNESLQRINNTFSYDAFISSARTKIPAFKLLFTISEHKNNALAQERLSQMNISVPTKVGTEPYGSLEGLTNIFYFINSVIFVITRSQENSSKLEEILKELETPPPQPKPQPEPVLPPKEATNPVTYAAPPVTNPSPGTFTTATRFGTDTRTNVNTGFGVGSNNTGISRR